MLVLYVFINPLWLLPCYLIDNQGIPLTTSECFPMARLNTQLQATGAEYLVLGQLLIHGIQAYKAHFNHPGYDLIAVNPDSQQACRIQVKSRFATDYGGGFPISNYECDFVIFVALNRGYRYAKAKNKAGDNLGVMEPVFYVLPVDKVKTAQRQTATWNKVYLKDIADAESTLNAWQQISHFLSVSA